MRFFIMTCKVCFKEKLRKNSKKYCEKCFRENEKERAKKWRKENIEKSRISSKIRYEKNKNILKIKQKQYKRKIRKENKLIKFKDNLRNLISNSFKRGSKNFVKKSKTFDILGCDIDFFIKYIESRFLQNMSLNNHGEWHLDHIIPLSTAKTEEEIIKLNHYTNFQPLWAKDNLKKSNKIILINTL